MNQLTPNAIRAFAREGGDTPPYIRVGMDTGGIAAGAKDVYEALVAAKDEFGAAIRIEKTGSLGLAYADPVVVFQRKSGRPIVFGNMDPEAARELMANQARRGVLLEDRVVASRDRGDKLGKMDQFAILVKDTSLREKEGRTRFIQEMIEEELEFYGLEKSVRVYRALDMGLYDRGVCLQLLPSGVTYAGVTGPDIRRIIKESLREGVILDELLVPGKEHQERIVLRNCGQIDPDSIESYIRADGYVGLARALTEMSPEDVIEEMKTSGLRGRGGAGFPTWIKWSKTREPEADRKFVICNADEGDPGAFMDRSVLEGDPHAVLEGLILSAYAIGAEKGFFYIRAEYPLAVKRVQQAIDQARDAGILGDHILGTDFRFDAEVRLGAGAFVCGEETALIASIEGRRGSPEPRPPYPSVKGLWDQPTSINNVETLAAASAVILKGGSWYAGFGTDDSKGTKVFAVTGKVRNSQLVEVPMGISIRSIIYDICGGPGSGFAIKAVQTGGPSGGVIPQPMMDTPVSYESLKSLGSIMGSGGMLVMDEEDCMVDVAKFYLNFCVDESCGKCAPCRVGGFQMLQLLEKIYSGNGSVEDIEAIRQICHCMRTASLCGLGQTAPNPVLSTLKYFESEYLNLLKSERAPAKSGLNLPTAGATW